MSFALAGRDWYRLLDVPRSALYVGLKPQTLRNRLARNSKNPFPVKPVKVGRRVFFDIRDLDELIDTAKRRGTSI